MSLPTPPAIFKPVLPHLKLAVDNETRDVVISYWCRYYAVQAAMKIDSKSTEAKGFLIALMDWLEKEKKSRKENDSISNDMVAQAHVENFAMKLFDKADGDDRMGSATLDTAKIYLASSNVFDVLSVFGEISPEVAQRQKYAKWRTSLIMKAIKSGEPVPPPENQSEFNQPPPAGFGTEDPNAPSFPGAPSWPSLPTNDDFGTPSTRDTPTNNYVPPAAPTSFTTPTPSNTFCAHQGDDGQSEQTKRADGSVLSPSSLMTAQKYCKYAGSALTYNDVTTAIDNLQKALMLLTTGKEIPQ